MNYWILNSWLWNIILYIWMPARHPDAIAKIDWSESCIRNNHCIPINSFGGYITLPSRPAFLPWKCHFIGCLGELPYTIYTLIDLLFNWFYDNKKVPSFHSPNYIYLLYMCYVIGVNCWIIDYITHDLKIVLLQNLFIKKHFKTSLS